jgi:restriction system protein
MPSQDNAGKERDMSIPDYQALMLPVLRGAAKEPRRVPELAEELADDLDLSEAEREAMLPSGRQRVLHNRVHWAKFYLSKAGLLDSVKRGVFTATPEGKTLLAQNPAKIDNDLLLKFPAFSTFYRGQSAVSEQSSATPEPEEVSLTPEESIDKAAVALEQVLRADLIDRILNGSPMFFEGLIVDLLVAMGYGGSHADAAQRIGKSGDGGVDGVISEDRLGLDRIYIQAKRYAPGNPIGRKEVQSFVGSLVGMGATKGVFVTVSTFTQNAREYAKHLAQRVILLEGSDLAALMIEHGVGVRTSRVVKVLRVDEEFFSEDE